MRSPRRCATPSSAGSRCCDPRSGSCCAGSAWSRAAQRGGSPRPSPPAARPSWRPRRPASCWETPKVSPFATSWPDGPWSPPSPPRSDGPPTARSSTCCSRFPGCPGRGWSTTPPSGGATGCWWRSARRRPPRRRVRGRTARASEILRLVLDSPHALSDHLTARLWSERSYSSYVVNQFEAAFTCAETAVALADRAEDRQVLMDALPVLARAAMFARGPEAARAAAQRAVDVSRREGDRVRLAAALTELARTHSNLPSVSVVAQPSSACPNRPPLEALAPGSRPRPTRAGRAVAVLPGRGPDVAGRCRRLRRPGAGRRAGGRRPPARDPGPLPRQRGRLRLPGRTPRGRRAPGGDGGASVRGVRVLSPASTGCA